MKKIITNINKNSPKSYLKIETTGLSKSNDTIISLSVIERDNDFIKTLVAEDLKDEERIVEYLKDNLKDDEYFTLSGNSFDKPFINEKLSFYFGKSFDKEFIDLQKTSKNYNYIFNLNSYSNRSLLDFFNIAQSSVNGRDLSKLYKEYLLGDEKSLDKIIEFSITNIKNLFILHERLDNFIKEKMSFSVDKFDFLIKDINLYKNNLIIEGNTNSSCNIFDTNADYSLTIDKKFKLEINTEDLPYDGEDLCYFVRKNKFMGVENKSKIKSPKEILILYYKDYLFENILELTKFIIEKSLKNKK